MTVRSQRMDALGQRLSAADAWALSSGSHEYVADVSVSDDTLAVALVRSTSAHARVLEVDTRAAARAPGVVSVVTAAELTGVVPVPDYFTWARPIALFPLAREFVRYVGCPIAAVVAENRYLAEDAAELIEVTLEELEPVTTIDGALAAEAPRLYRDWPDNRMIAVHHVDEALDAAFRVAARTIGGTYTTRRHIASPMEPRATMATCRDGRVTLTTTSQFPHITRTVVADALGLNESELEVVSPHLGGGFGAKCQVYPEEILVAWLSRKLGRSVRFIEDRVEHMVATTHARDMVIQLEAALNEEHAVLAVRGKVVQDLGSEEAYPPAFAMGLTAAASVTLPYRIPLVQIGTEAVVTNKTPAGAYRGFGLVEATFAMERLLDRIARETRRDPVELRRSLLLRREDLPYRHPNGSLIDSGSHVEAFDLVVELGRAALQEELAGHLNPDVRLGVGFANYVEGMVPTFRAVTGRWSSEDSCTVSLTRDGRFVVATGLTSMGQGLEQVLSVISAQLLDVSPSDVEVKYGDTRLAPPSLGSWGSRSTSVFAGACSEAVTVLKAEALRLASRHWEAAIEDVVYDESGFHLRGTTRSALSWSDVARLAADDSPGESPVLTATATFYPPGVQDEPDDDGAMNACATYTNSSHAAVVAVDTRTGFIEVRRYFVVHDCGRMVNPLLVEGQVHGGVVQGIGGALLEEFTYDERGQPTSANLADYLLPLATDVPTIEVHHLESPSPFTPFGMKGAGESGIAGPAPAIAQAIENALDGLMAAEIHETPITPRRLVDLLIDED